jgi:hypothetical protein
MENGSQIFEPFFTTKELGKDLRNDRVAKQPSLDVH